MTVPGASSARLLWWRWSVRDLRKRWVSVIAIAVVIAIGTGVYAGLGSTATWRKMSNDASFAALRMHDLQATLTTGTFADEGALVALVGSLPAAAEGAVESVEERLIVPTQVDASYADETVLVPGRLVGADTAQDAAVNALHLERGRRPSPATAEQPVEIVLEQKFARHYDLPADGTAVLAGGNPVRYVGHGMGPEYFFITGSREAGLFAEANFAVMFAELADAQRVSGQPGRVNDVVIRLSEGADRDEVEAQLRAAITASGTYSATVATRDDNANYRLLYDDIEGDQKVWNALSILILGAAAIAAFNLIGRIVDSQRREIGVQMALGVPPRRIMRRPVLVAAQIALIGAVCGVGVGLLVGAAMRSILTDFLPLPDWRTPFQFRTYAGAAALGFVLPFVASILPVRRAVRVEPVDAIRTGHLAVRGGRLTALGHRMRLRHHGSSLRRLPLRNTLRAPRRTALTALGVGAAIAALVAVFGMLDSFYSTIQRGEAELLTSAPDRVIVQLDGFQPADGDLVERLRSLPEVGHIDPQLSLPVTLLDGPPDGDGAGSRDGDIEILVQSFDFATTAWSPTVESPAPSEGSPGIVLARKAASDLGLSPGDTVPVRHPAATGPLGFGLVTTSFTVTGTHPNPLRTLAYIDAVDQGVFGLDGIVNSLDVLPAEGVTDDQLRRALFEQPGVSSAQPISALTGLFSDVLEQFVSFLLLAAGAVLVLALLIAFNSTSIAVDERTREHATLFAFGLPLRSVLSLIAKESVLVGAASTLVGLGLGYLLTRWMIGSILTDTAPDFGFDITISLTTVATALVVGIAAVALTPLFLIRRLRRMSIPDALRVME